jgi:hypothetical protein
LLNPISFPIYLRYIGTSHAERGNTRSFQDAVRGNACVSSFIHKCRLHLPLPVRLRRAGRGRIQGQRIRLPLPAGEPPLPLL